MAKPRAKSCKHCGCDRKIIIKASVTEQSATMSATYSTYPLCVPCFLEMIGLKEQANFKNLPKSVLDCVEQ